MISEVFLAAFQQLIHYITSFQFCQEVSEIFFSNFSWFFSYLMWYQTFCLPLSQQLIYYITLFSFCQVVSQNFLKNFFLDIAITLWSLFQRRSRNSFYIILFLRHFVNTHLEKSCTISFPYFQPYYTYPVTFIYTKSSHPKAGAISAIFRSFPGARR